MVQAIVTIENETLRDETITVSTAAVGLTATKIQPSPMNSDNPPANGAIIQAQGGGGPLRYRVTAAPDANTGGLLYDGGTLIIRGQNELDKIQFIRDASATADEKLFVTYTRR